jgi:hypothetical protein
VGRIIDMANLHIDVFNYLEANDLLSNKIAWQMINQLHQMVHTNRVINYYLETSQDLDKVLNIFVRINSGGTKLDYSDILLSMASAQWKKVDARKEVIRFVDDLNKIGDGFDFDKDFVLKSCLVLSDIPDIAFKVDNFNLRNMTAIEDNWKNIKKSLNQAVELVSSIGYCKHNLPSNNAIIPIAYYLLTIKNPVNFMTSSAYNDDRKNIKRYFNVSIIKRIFSGQPDSVLRPTRSIIKESKDGFPLKEIVDRFRGTPKTFVFTEDDIDVLLDYKYGNPYMFTILSLLYPANNYKATRFEVDHIHPKSGFTLAKLAARNIPREQWRIYQENCDKICNLELLDDNTSKGDSDFEGWLNRRVDKTDFMNKHSIPKNVPLGFDHFEEFAGERSKLLAKKYKEILL